MTQPKFAIGQTVEKWTGNYGGLGVVRGIANDSGQPLRYLVGHKIDGGFGEFYHVYAEGNLREPTRFQELSTMLRERDGEAVSKARSLIDIADRSIEINVNMRIALHELLDVAQGLGVPSRERLVMKIQAALDASEQMPTAYDVNAAKGIVS